MVKHFKLISKNGLKKVEMTYTIQGKRRKKYQLVLDWMMYQSFGYETRFLNANEAFYFLMI